jgi:quercetin dioxygenase-like cupin family protein
MISYFISLNELPKKESLNAAFASTVQTENLTVAYTDMRAGCEVPLHNHPEEAVDIILEGILEMQVGNKTDTLSNGMISIVPSNVPHKAKAITDCKVVTVFYPKRQM